MSWSPQMTGIKDGPVIRLGHPLIDAYLEFVAARARANTLLAQAFDLKVFFSFVSKDPSDVTTTDVLAFINAQRQPRHGAKVVRIQDGETGLLHGRSSGGWRRLPVCMNTCSYAAIPEWRAIRSLAVWRCVERASAAYR